MKVYGLTVTPSATWGADTPQVRVIVAAGSAKAAALAFRRAGLSASENFVRTRGAVTWNAHEREAAMRQPGVVYFADEGKPSGDSFVPIAEANP